MDVKAYQMEIASSIQYSDQDSDRLKVDPYALIICSRISARRVLEMEYMSRIPVISRGMRLEVRFAP